MPFCSFDFHFTVNTPGLNYNQKAGGIELLYLELYEDSDSGGKSIKPNTNPIKRATQMCCTAKSLLEMKIMSYSYFF